MLSFTIAFFSFLMLQRSGKNPHYFDNRMRLMTSTVLAVQHNNIICVSPPHVYHSINYASANPGSSRQLYVPESQCNSANIVMFYTYFSFLLLPYSSVWRIALCPTCPTLFLKPICNEGHNHKQGLFP